MDFARRQLMLAGLGFGLAAFAFPRLPPAREAIVPGGGEIDQTAMLQDAIDRAARTGVSLFLPAGIYATRTLTLKSGTQIDGVPGRTILRHRGGRSILRVEHAENVRLSGLILDGDRQTLGADGALLAADDVSGLDIRACRFIGSSEDGITLHRVSGRIAGNVIDKAATGLSISGSSENNPVVVEDNFIRGLFLRKTLVHSGVGIVADGGAIIRGNVIDGAPAYGILLGDPHTAHITGNTIRNAYIDVASAPVADTIAC